MTPYEPDDNLFFSNSHCQRVVSAEIRHGIKLSAHLQEPEAEKCRDSVILAMRGPVWPARLAARWTLREEHRKGRKRNVGHRLASILTLAAIRQRTGDFRKAPDDF